MFDLANQLRADGGGPVHDLSLGNPSLEPPEVWRRAVLDLLQTEPPGMHRYMTSAGFPEVREFLAERESARYGLELSAQDVTMTVGAAGGLNVIFNALVDPSDEIVVPAPYFSEYEHYCENVGAALVPVATTLDFQLDPTAIDAAIGPKCRVVMLNSPNNPSGAIYSHDALVELAGVLERSNRTRTKPIVVVEDAPYRDLVHDGTDAPSILQHYPHSVLVTSHSKDLGLAGERIGYVVVSPQLFGRDFVNRAAAFCNRVLGFVNAPALMQRILPIVLADPMGRVDVTVYARRCRTMAEGLRALGFEIPVPRAGFFLFPRLPDRLRTTDGGDIALAQRLVEERTIVVPGTAFGGPGHLRLSMATSEEAVASALAAFTKVCAEV